MPTHESETNASLGTATKQVAEHASSLARLELELAILELKRKVTALGIGIGLGIGALVFLLFFVGFAYATAAAALATLMPTWAALLIVTGALLFKATLLGVFALARIRKGTPPVPEQAIEEAKRTTEVLRADANA